MYAHIYVIKIKLFIKINPLKKVVFLIIGQIRIMLVMSYYM